MGSTAASGGIAAGSGGDSNDDSLLKNRTFDVTWVEKSALMYKEGYAKTFDKETRKASIQIKRKSSIPIILRDMAPPEGSIFDPAKKWEEEKERRGQEQKKEGEEKKKAGKKVKKQSAAESIRDSNAA